MENPLILPTLTFLCVVPILTIGLAWYVFRLRKQIEAMQGELQDRSQRLQKLEKDAVHTIRTKWLQRISTLSFANETEVEIKFVYSLLMHLGYKEDDFSVRYKVKMQLGREQVQKEADWVVWRKNGNEPQATLVIEAKHSTQSLDRAVQDQARSYAFHVRAPFYILTNGVDLILYKLDIAGDQVKFQHPITHLEEHWQQLVDLVGAR